MTTTIINAQNNSQDLFTITFPFPRVPLYGSGGQSAVLTFDTTNVSQTAAASLNGATGQITLSSTGTVYQISAQAEITNPVPVHLKLVETATGNQVGVAVPITMPLNVVLQPASAGDYQIVVYTDEEINFEYPTQIRLAQVTVQALNGQSGFNQSLNTTDSVEFANINVTGIITATVMTVEHTTVTTVIVETDDIIRTTNATAADAGVGAIVATAGGISATNGYFSDTTNATNSTTGAVRVVGGLNVGNDIWVQGGDIRGPTVRLTEQVSGFVKKYIDVNTNQIDLSGTTKVSGTLEITGNLSASSTGSALNLWGGSYVTGATGSAKITLNPAGSGGNIIISPNETQTITITSSTTVFYAAGAQKAQIDQGGFTFEPSGGFIQLGNSGGNQMYLGNYNTPFTHVVGVGPNDVKILGPNAQTLATFTTSSISMDIGASRRIDIGNTSMELGGGAVDFTINPGNSTARSLTIGQNSNAGFMTVEPSQVRIGVANTDIATLNTNTTNIQSYSNIFGRGTVGQNVFIGTKGSTILEIKADQDGSGGGTSARLQVRPDQTIIFYDTAYNQIASFSTTTSLFSGPLKVGSGSGLTEIDTGYSSINSTDGTWASNVISGGDSAQLIVGETTGSQQASLVVERQAADILSFSIDSTPIITANTQSVSVSTSLFNVGPVAQLRSETTTFPFGLNTATILTVDSAVYNSGRLHVSVGGSLGLGNEAEHIQIDFITNGVTVVSTTSNLLTTTSTSLCSYAVSMSGTDVIVEATNLDPGNFIPTEVNVLTELVSNSVS